MQDILIRTREILAQADTTMAIVLAGVAVVAILLIVGAAIFIVRMYTPKGRLDMLLESRAPERATNPWVARALVILTVVLIVVATTMYAERPQSCMSCHQDAVYSEGVAESTHASVTCAQCHRSSGVTGRIDDTVRYAGWLWAYYLQAEEMVPGTGAFVDSRTCLDCHAAVLEGVIEANGIRVRHSDFIEGTAACTVCHGDVGHAEQRGVQGQPVMNGCMACHNDEDAPAACTHCHVQDFGVTAVARRGGQMNTVGIRQTDCYGCHPVQGCNECHGITMPHEPGYFNEPPPGARQRRAIWVPNRIGGGFPPGSHARDGFVNRELCWRCHFAEDRPFERSDEGCWCHGVYGYQHGGPAWVREHGLQATGQKTGTLSDCSPCHGPASEFCTFCHPPSMAERYAPRPGPDNYSASPGWPRRDPLDPDW